MDFRKAILYGALVMLSWNLWTKWQEEHTAKAPVASVAPQTSMQATPEQTAKPVAETQIKATPSTPEQLITIETDVMKVKINTRGGEIVSTQLLDYAKELGQNQQPIELLNDDPESRFVAQSGLIAAGGRNIAVIPSFSAAKTAYAIEDGKDNLDVVLTTTLSDGLKVTKTFSFKRNSYLIDMKVDMNNQSGSAWKGQQYTQLLRRNPPEQATSMFGVHAYSGAAISDPKNKLYEKVDYSQMAEKPLDRVIEGGWAAIQQHYFLAAWVPEANQRNTYYSNVSQGGEYTIGMYGPELTIDAGKSLTTQAKLYVGPEITTLLAPIAPGLEKTMDYGWLWFISTWIFWLLSQIHRLIGNWGWAIVAVTVLIKLAFYRLSAAAYRSMARMRELQPRMVALRERYANDKALLSQKTMELYRTEKINPLGGCLPILVQIPVFIGLYWVLLEAVELRHAPFMLWIHDLSAYDPYFVLPILMGLSMLVQQRLNPAPPDPTQAKVMMVLPVLFTGLFLYFPSGLVLYWMVNNVLSIAQQWYIMKTHSSGRVEKSAKNKPSYGSGS